LSVQRYFTPFKFLARFDEDTYLWNTYDQSNFVRTLFSVWKQKLE